MGIADALSQQAFQARAAEAADVFRSQVTEVEVSVPDTLLVRSLRSSYPQAGA